MGSYAEYLRTPGGSSDDGVSKTSSAYLFGSFRVDAANRLLTRDESPVAVTPKVFDTLLFLVERWGKLVTKDELMSALWPDTVVCESNLTQTIFMLRKALGENAGDPKFIVTVPGRGYRFAAEVRPVSSDVEAPVGVQPDRLPSRVIPGSVAWAFAAVATALLIATVVLWSRSHRPSPPPAQRVMLAVLPFQNLTGNPDDEYFADGFTEELIEKAGKIDTQRLAVIARPSVMNYIASSKTLAQIGNELGVQYVVQGTIRRDEHRVWIRAGLVRIKDQTHVWTREYDRDLSDVLNLQEEVGEAIAGEIRNALGEHDSIQHSSFSALPVTNYEAYDLQLKARYFLSKRTAPALQKASEYFEQSIAKDPSSARAYAGLASTYALMSGYSGRPQPEFMPKAREAALHAIALDDHLAEGHVALALITQNYEWDWETAEREYRRAIELDPNFATAHHWYAEHLALRGKFPEAFVEIERARQLDPLSMIIATDRGAILYDSRQYDRAAQQLRAILDMEPTFVRAHLLTSVYLAQGRYDEALVDMEKWERIQKDNPWISIYRADIYGRTGRRREAERLLGEILQRSKRHPMDPAAFVSMYMCLGDRDQAFAWLEKARQQHSNVMTTLKVDPMFDSLRSDPRFNEYLKIVNLLP